MIHGIEQPLLDVRNVSISFGGLKAVADVSLSLPRGALYGLIGPNGAGKTTIFNLLTGVYAPSRGVIELAGQRISGRKPFQIAQAGLSRTFQNIRLFPDMSVLDNVRLACHLRGRNFLHDTLLRTFHFRRQESAIIGRSLTLLSRFGLDRQAMELARNLSYGDQRRLEICRALATEPVLLLLDEPAAGMNPREKETLSTQIRALRDDFRLTILLIEHDMQVVMGLCERITVLDYGQVIAEGTPEQVRNNDKVIEAYLGEPAH